MTAHSDEDTKKRAGPLARRPPGPVRPSAGQPTIGTIVCYVTMLVLLNYWAKDLTAYFQQMSHPGGMRGSTGVEGIVLSETKRLRC